MSNDTTIRWGIVGAGRIARRFAQGLAHVPGAVLSGVWSRRPEPARALAAAFGARAFDSFDALIGGTLGTATIHENWWNPARATVRYLDGRTVELDAPFEGGGLNYETAHFCELLRAGAIESPVMSHATSMRMIAIIDAARRDLGLRFPFESE